MLKESLIMRKNKAMNDEFKPPEPEEGKDYYTEEVRRYTVTIEVDVKGNPEELDSTICSRAVEGLRKGTLDGSSQVVMSEKIGPVELCDDDVPFDREAWVKQECAKMGVNVMGEPLKPHEIERPGSESKLWQFIACKP